MMDFSLEFVFASGEKHSPKEESSEWLLRSDADTVADSLTVRFSAGQPPMEPKARTGLLTPPGMSFTAFSKSSSDLVIIQFSLHP